MKTTKTLYDNLPVKNDSITQNHSRICVRYISVSKDFIGILNTIFIAKSKILLKYKNAVCKCCNLHLKKGIDSFDLFL